MSVVTEVDQRFPNLANYESHLKAFARNTDISPFTGEFGLGESYLCLSKSCKWCIVTKEKIKQVTGYSLLATVSCSKRLRLEDCI